MLRKLLICSVALLVVTAGVNASQKGVTGISNTAASSPGVRSPDINPGGMVFVRGKITDRKGFPVKGIKLILQKSLGGEVQQTKTDADGSYKFRLRMDRRNFRKRTKMMIIMRVYFKAHYIRQVLIKFDMKKNVTFVSKNIVVPKRYRMFE